MRRLTAAALALSICTFLSPGVALRAQQMDPGAVKAYLDGLSGEAREYLLRSSVAELVDANGKVVQTQSAPIDGAFNFQGVPPGNYTVRTILRVAVGDVTGARIVSIPAGSALVTVASGATANVTVGITAAAAAAAASAAAGGTTAVAGAAGSPGLFGMGAAGTALAFGAAAGIITAVALTRGDSSPSR